MKSLRNEVIVTLSLIVFMIGLFIILKEPNLLIVFWTIFVAKVARDKLRKIWIWFAFDLRIILSLFFK